MANDLKGSVITAEQARTAADTTDLVLKRIYKEIRYLANEGMTVLYWSRANLSIVLLDSIRANLIENGYAVGFVDDTLKISW